jgi:hypothetical protein
MIAPARGIVEARPQRPRTVWARRRLCGIIALMATSHETPSRIDFAPYLADLERRIDPDEEARIHGAWIDFLEGRLEGRLAPGEPFVPPARVPNPPKERWPRIHINDALADIDTMVLHQLSLVSDVLASGGSSILNVRTNYGVSIMTSQLGCEVVTMARKQGNLPTTKPLGGFGPLPAGRERVDEIRAALDRGVPDLRAGQGGDVFDCGERFAELLSGSETLDRWILLYHPDAQGPVDNAELAWGSDIFLAFYDDPELVHRFLDLMVDHYLAFLGAWFAAHPPRGPYSAHWGNLMKGQVMLRDDSLMNLSPAIYDEFIRDRETRCIRELGGGAIHYCGRGSHVIDRFRAMEGLHAVNLSQPHLNEMDVVFRETVDHGLNLLSLDAAAAARAASAGTNLRGRVHCPA